MSRTVWRIASDTPAYEADDLSGMGAKISGGRWNAAGTPAVYASGSRAMACLETIVHFNASGLPLNRYLVSIEIPDEVWAGAQSASVGSLDIGWDAEPPGRVSIRFGTNWLTSKISAILIVPSVIIPEEWNVVINPLHVDSARVSAAKVRKWSYDPRFYKSA